MPKLIAIAGPSRGREYTLEEEFVLGRDSTCQLYISDLVVSRLHARVIQSSDGGYEVQDLQSGNGTFVNDQRIERQQLQHGDEIRVGDCVLRFITDEGLDYPIASVATVISPNGDNVIRTVSTAETPLRDLRQVATGVEFETGLARAHRMVDTLLAVANATSSLLDPAKLFNTVLNYLFDVIPDAARGFVMTLDEVDQLRPAAIRVRQDRGSGGSLSLAQGVVNRVLRQGKAVLCDPAEGWKHHKRVASTISAPLMVRGKILGIIHIEGCESGQPFDKEDLDLLSGIAMQVGVAYHNASLHQRLMRQQRLEQDLRFARRVQHSFLPSEPPEVPGFLFSRSYNPVFQVGGDLYDFIPLPDERIGVLIGDVAGKGVSAALMMARLTSDMRYFAISESSPARVLDRANTSMFTHMQDNMFVTLLYLVLDVPGRSMTLCNAGHIPPLIRRAGNGHVAELDEATNLALGVLPDPTFDEVTLQLELGDSVLLTTDGVVEAKSRAGEEFGFDRLRHALSSATAKRLLDTVLADVQGYTEGTAQYDDITMVAFTRTE